MRLNEKSVATIKEAAKTYFDENTRVYLFGSRADDSQKGGDIDLYVETKVSEDLLKRKLRMLAMLHKVLGEQKIDIVIKRAESKRYIDEIAKNEGIAL
jgi:predicted nucleotidyltransferase